MKHLICSTFVIFGLFSFGFSQSPITDTLEYPNAKTSGYLGSVINNPSGYPSYAQYYEAPQQITVKGLTFYAGILSVTNVSDTLTCNLYQANSDSTPGILLATKEIIVSNTYPQSGIDPNGSNLDTMKLSVLFDTPVTLNAHFLIGIEYNDTLSMGTVTNNHLANDGGLEELAFYKWAADSIWYKSNAGCLSPCWDVDFLIMPIVEYVPGFTSSTISSTCSLDACVNYSGSVISSHRMYNEVVFNGNNPSDSTSISWGDNFISFYSDTCHTYSNGGNFQILVSEQIGWGTTSSSSDTSQITISGAQGVSSVIPVTCNGLSDGSATVTASGGIAPYTYLWSDNANQTTATAINLSAGNYSVIVSDSIGCYDTITAIVTEPNVLSVYDSVSISTACNPDSSATASVVVSGGTSPYNYLWNDPSAQTNQSAVNLPSGNYTVIVSDNNGCSTTDSVDVGLYIAISSNAPVCGGICDGTASITATGSGGVYSFMWDDPASQTSAITSGLCDGFTYTVIVSDSGGCTKTDSVVFAPLTPLSVSINVSNIDCFGNSNGSATAIASGTSGYSYFWPSLGGATNAFQNNLGPGNYDVIITDLNGCSKQTSATITEPSAPLSSSISTTITSCYGGSDGAANLSVSGGTSPYIYNWVGSATGQDTSGMVAGSYWVSIEDDNGCMTTDTAVVSEPNPLVLSGSSSADAGSGNGAAWVVASGGTTPYAYAWDDPASQVSDTANGLTMGNYQVVVTDNNGCNAKMDIGVADLENPVFENTIEGEFDDFARSVDIVSGGGYIVAGYTESFGSGGSDAYLVQTDNNGNYNWSKSYGGDGDDAANSVVHTSDGGYILAGYSSSFGSGGNDMFYTKTDANGNIVWSETHGGSGEEKAYSVVELSTGGYIIAGGTNSFGAGNTDMYLIRLDANGALLWTKTYGGAGFDYAYDAKETNDGGYILAGYTYSYGAGSADFYLVKTDGSGTIQWTKAIGGLADDFAWSVVEISSGGYAIAGNSKSFGGGEEDIYFIITDANGTPVVSKTFGGTSEDFGTDLTETTDGGFAITGYSKSFTNNAEDIYLIKTDANGAEIWTNLFSGSFNDRAWAVKQSADNGYVIAGNSQSFGLTVVPESWEQYIIKTSANGNSNCNSSSVSPSGQNVTSQLTIGGSDGSGGVSIPAPSVAITASALSQFICYETTGTKQVISENSNILIYPNPNSGQFYLQIQINSKQSTDVRIYDIKGQLVISKIKAGKNQMQLFIDLGEVPAGIYYVQLISENEIISETVVVQ